MALLDIEIKALEFYRADLMRRFKKVDDIVSGNWTAQLMAVQKEIRGLIHSERPDPKNFPELNRLWKEERRLKALEKKSFDLSVTRQRADLKSELQDVERALSYCRWVSRLKLTN